MTSGSFEKFEEKLEREDYIQSIIREYYARKNAEVEKNMKLEVNKWKNIEKKQKEINFKATGFHETNRERKEREASSRENKLIKRDQQVKNLLRKKEGTFCIYCKTKVDRNGLCYC